MAPESAPAFLFYVQDFLTDARSAGMSLEVRGAYITLLAYEWREGALPVGPEALAALLHITAAQFARLWPQLADVFTETEDGRLVNERLERERRHQRQREAARRRLEDVRTARARAGARARWGKAGAFAALLLQAFN